MSAPPPKKSKTTPTALVPALVTIILGSMAAIYASRDETKVAGPRASFDFYLLAMTVHASFCAEHESKTECRVAQPKPLVIHGLWPERTVPNSYPRDCPAPPLSLEPELARELATLMPGMKDGLHEHEWRKHGSCSELTDDEYFDMAYEYGKRLDAALGDKLTTLAGRETTATELRTAADSFEPGMGSTLTFHCRMPAGRGDSAPRRPWLFEVRQCLDDDSDGALGAPLECASVDRRDQGCGGRFFVPGRR